MIHKKQIMQVSCMALLIGIFTQCALPLEKRRIAHSNINTTHLDNLYAEGVVEGDTIGIVHIYSEYPDYRLVGDEDEGIACVDDATRAAIFYLKHYRKTLDPKYLRKGRMLLNFLLTMQAPNGYYYNFIWPDGKINTTGSTSVAEPNFWSWRVLWAFGEALDVLKKNDPLVSEIRAQRKVLIRKILSEESFKSNQTDTAMGVTFATWLPKTSGTDQAAIILIGMTKFLQQYSATDSIEKKSVVSFMEHFAEGITLMQVEQPDSLHDGAFLSWENLWHAYANIQSYALLVAGEELKDPHMISHAMYEIDRFYPSFLKAGGLEHFFVRIVDEKIERYDTKAFSQIAYGRRPMIWAALKAYEMTKKEKYLTLANDLAAWFSGKNPANVLMYDPATGRGYDGIVGQNMYNKNAGAESTVESLLSIQALENYEK